MKTTKRRSPSGPGFGTNRIVINVRKPLTSGQAASLCGVSPRTITVWCDKGKLKYYRLPLSKDRRIYVRDLVDFMRKNSIPIPSEIAPDSQIRFGVNSWEWPKFQHVSLVSLAKLIANQPISMAVIGDLEGRDLARAAARMIRDDCPKCHIVLYASEDWQIGREEPFNEVIYRHLQSWNQTQTNRKQP